MKKGNTLKILTVLPIILELISLLFLPDQIPVHYSMNLQEIEYGNKFMILVLGVITILLGAFLNLICRANRNKESEAITFKLSVVALAIFNVLNMLSLIGAFVLS